MPGGGVGGGVGEGGGGHGGGGAAPDGAADDSGAGDRGEDGGGGRSGLRLFALLPRLWELLDQIPPSDGRGRGAIVRGMGRLCRHAGHLSSRAQDLLVPLLSLLGDEDAPTRCVRGVLPAAPRARTLVRAVTSLPEHEAISPRHSCTR